MSVDWARVVGEFWNEQPHPRAPGLKIGEFATAVKLATVAKFGGHASPQEAELFWREFKTLGMSPEDFEQTLERLAPLSYTFHGRPPTMKEISTLKDKMPHEARKYFADLPDRHHPSVTAGEMVTALQAARPWARQYLGRESLKNEAAYIHHSREAPDKYFARLAAQQPPEGNMLSSEGGLQAQTGGDGGGGGAPVTRGSQAQQ